MTAHTSARTLAHPVDALATRHLWLLFALSLVLTLSLAVAFRSIGGQLPAAQRPSLERFATARSAASAAAMLHTLGGAGRQSLQLALTVDAVFPIAYASALVVVALLVGRIARARGGGTAAFVLATAGAWAATFMFVLDHTENLFLWLESGPSLPSWAPRVTFAVNRAKWGCLLVTMALVLINLVAAVIGRRRNDASS
jgi:hypothetical protein